MERFNRASNLGYLISKNGTILPIRPLEITSKTNKKGRSYKKGEKLYIHGDILKYYIVEDYIKRADHLLNADKFLDLYCGITDLNLTLIIRAMHELNFFLPDHVSKQEYDAMMKVLVELKEPVKGVGRPFIVDGHYEIETFPDLKTAIKTINTRYKEKKSGKVK